MDAAAPDCTSFGMLTTTWPSGRYSTIGWVDDSNRCWMMFIMGGTSGWASSDRRHSNLTKRANRVSTRSSKYTGDSATFMKTKARLSKSLDREATLAEKFKNTHTLKENKARFADQQSQDHYRPRLNNLWCLSKVGRTLSMDLRPQSSTPTRFGVRPPQPRTKTVYTRWDRSLLAASAPRR
ncbi:hypothetical protein Ahy_B02g061518 [Arachis hypogaea]|uniref:Uncharacterized protein n=1 Tax=Arachis hypogaea TaxID=3818 RepID=A0A445AL56_ARAHY|nr:hypothetical protein Ahy_B02g061518 [Arachis hypogaea]